MYYVLPDIGKLTITQVMSDISADLRSCKHLEGRTGCLGDIMGNLPL